MCRVPCISDQLSCCCRAGLAWLCGGSEGLLQPLMAPHQLPGDIKKTSGMHAIVSWVARDKSQPFVHVLRACMLIGVQVLSYTWPLVLISRQCWNSLRQCTTRLEQQKNYSDIEHTGSVAVTHILRSASD